MLWVYGHKKYFYSYSAGTDFSRRQILTTKIGPGTVRVTFSLTLKQPVPIISSLFNIFISILHISF